MIIQQQPCLRSAFDLLVLAGGGAEQHAERAASRPVGRQTLPTRGLSLSSSRTRPSPARLTQPLQASLVAAACKSYLQAAFVIHHIHE